MLDFNQSILNSIAKMTKYKDLGALSTSLVKTVPVFIRQVTHAFVIGVEGEQVQGQQSHELKIIAASQTGIESLTQLDNNHCYQSIMKSCISEKTVIQEKNSDNSMVCVPICDEKLGQVPFILLVEAAELLDQECLMIQSFGKIFENFMQVINESERDELTSLLNRKHFHQKLQGIIKQQKHMLQTQSAITPNDRRHLGSDDRFWLGIFDIDHFKRINDTYGHLYGDDVLLLVSRILIESLRNQDLIFRYGGEEFIAVVGPCSEDTAISVFERVRRNIASRAYGKEEKITVSIGVAQAKPNDIPTSLVGNADRALYFAKENGRNQVAVFEHLVAQGKLNMPDIEDDIELF